MSDKERLLRVARDLRANPPRDKPPLIDRAVRYATVLAELHGNEGDLPDQRRDHYILVLGAEVVKLREKLFKLGAVMRDEDNDSDEDDVS